MQFLKMFGAHLAENLKPIPTTVTTLTGVESTENRIDGSGIFNQLPSLDLAFRWPPGSQK